MMGATAVSKVAISILEMGYVMLDCLTQLLAFMTTAIAVSA